MGKGASIQIGRRIGSEEGYLRVKDVENEPSLVPKMAFHAMEKLLERGFIPKDLQRIKRHDDQREPVEIEGDTVSSNPADAEALAFRLTPGLLQHGTRYVEADDIETC